MNKRLIRFIREVYETNEVVPLHAPSFFGNEVHYLKDTIDSTFVSSVGKYVDQFEENISRYTNSPAAIATVNGTAALHTALKLVGVQAGDLVITQPLTFVATCNAISYCSAEPIFVDVDRLTLGLSSVALDEWLSENAYIDDKEICRSRLNGRVIRACMPMHTFGHPADMDSIMRVCNNWKLAIVEDAAESLGSFYRGRHTGTFGEFGAISFNGNKIITTGGGGIVLVKNKSMGIRAKHLTTTAKLPHPYEYIHDETAYNYRMPNLNAALGCAQLQQLNFFISCKRRLAHQYQDYFNGSELMFVEEPEGCRSNYWLNTIICPEKHDRDILIKETNGCGVMTRPIWSLMTNLPMYSNCQVGNIENSTWLESRIINLPSGVPSGMRKEFKCNESN